MITPSFSLTATERVLPKLALDFTTASLDSRITFTRTTGASNPATYVNSSGVITAATNNQPRFDCDPVTLACKGLLIEESRANSALYSQDFTNAVWNTVIAAITLDTTGIAAPDGTSTGATITAPASSSKHGLIQLVACSAGATYTVSYFVKAKTGRYVCVGDGGDASWHNVYADLQLGTITVQNNCTGTITAFGNSWYRITATFTRTNAGSIYAGVWASNTGTGTSPPTYTGAGESYYVWGNQTETGAFATSYIPTTTTALTRNADVATMTGTNFTSWFNASEGTFTLTSIAGTNVGYASGAYTQRGIEVSSATNAYMTIARLNTATTARLLVVDGTTQVAIDQSNYTQNTASTFTFGYKLNNYVFAGNGAAVTTDTAATVPTCSTLNIGKATTSEGFLNGWIRKINYYPMRLTNAEVQAFSKG